MLFRSDESSRGVHYNQQQLITAMRPLMLRTAVFHCRRERPSYQLLSSVLHMSGKAKRQITFAGSLGSHLLEIKARHLDMSNQLMESDKLEVSEITRISKDCAELSRIVELVDQRIAVIESIVELQAMEKEETARYEAFTVIRLHHA